MASCCQCKQMERSKSTPFYPTWMADLPKNLHTKPLNTIAIPGSHDSFSAFLDPKGGTAPNCPGFAKELAKIFGSTAANIIYKWSVTQEGGFYRQLIAGIRYLDLRVAVNKTKDDQLYFCHGLYAQSVEDGLLDVVQFLEEHPREVVLLDFNHLYGMETAKHHELVAMIQQKFGSRLCPTQPMDQVTLENLWKNDQQVLVFYHDADTVKEFPILWKDEAIPSPWANTCDVGKLIHFLTENFQKTRDTNAFYVTQGVLTPSVSYVVKHLFGGLHKDLSDIIVQPFLHWLLQKYSGPKGINVCILDFANDNEYIPVVLDLNKNYREDL